jgi:hypothetical protein
MRMIMPKTWKTFAATIAAISAVLAFVNVGCQAVNNASNAVTSASPVPDSLIWD